MLLLDVGSGERPYEDGRGWTHVDFRSMGDDTVECDVSDLLTKFEPDSADEILARHILEHFRYRQTVDVLGNWLAVLKPGGLLQVEVPNLGWQCRALTYHEMPDEEIVNLMFGEQDHVGNFHYAGFTFSLLEQRLREAGFDDVVVQDIGMVLVARARKP